MSLLSAILGICLYVLVKLHMPHVFLTVVIVGGLGVVFFWVAVAIGARRPRLTSSAYQASILFGVAVGALLAYAIILLTTLALELKGPTPSPSVETVISSFVVLLGALTDHIKGMSRLMPAHLAESSVRRLYQGRFPKLVGEDPEVDRLAYEAIFFPSLSDRHGSIRGWGYASTRRRLELIRSALDVDAKAVV